MKVKGVEQASPELGDTVLAIQIQPNKVPEEHVVQVKISEQAWQLGMHSTQATDLATLEESIEPGRGAIGGYSSMASPTVRGIKLPIGEAL